MLHEVVKQDNKKIIYKMIKKNKNEITNVFISE